MFSHALPMGFRHGHSVNGDIDLLTHLFFHRIFGEFALLIA
jgi:hypothetical protein